MFKRFFAMLLFFVFLAAFTLIGAPKAVAQTQATFDATVGVALINKGDIKLEFLYGGDINADNIIWGSFDTTIAVFDYVDTQNKKVALFTPKKQGVTNLWAAYPSENGYSASLARMQLTVFEKAENIEIVVDRGDKNYLAPDNDVILEVRVNGESNLLNDLVNWRITNNGENVSIVGIRENLSKIAVKNLSKGSYTAYCMIGETETQINFSVISQGTHTFLTVVLPYLSLLLVIAVIVFVIFRKRKNPFDKCKTKAVSIAKKIQKVLQEADKTRRFVHKGFDKFLSSSHLLFLADDLKNSMYDINLNTVTQCQPILNKTKELSDIINAFYHSQRFLSANQQIKILSNLQEVILPDLITSLEEASAVYERAIKAKKPEVKLNIKTFNKNGQKNNLNYLYQKFNLNEKDNEV